MKIENNEYGRVIRLETERELRAYLHPLRQQILAALERSRDGMSAKQLADALGIAPSSAGHHLQTLERVGLVELDRVERIHGFQAKIYKEAPVTVSIGYVPSGDNLHAALVQSNLSRRSQRLMDAIAAACKIHSAEEEVHPVLDEPRFSNGVVYCTPEEMELFLETVCRFTEQHKLPREGKTAFETTFFYYASQLADEGERLHREAAFECARKEEWSAAPLGVFDQLWAGRDGFWLKKRFCAMPPEKWAAWVSSLDPAKVLGWLSLGYGAALLACGGLAYLVLRALALPWAGQATLFALACCALGFALRLCRNHQSLLEKLRRTRQGPGTGGVSGGERK